MQKEEPHDRGWLDILTRTHNEICTLPDGHSYALYKIVYLAFRRVAPVDSFYVCLYVPQDALPLWFPYNVDSNDEWDEPARLPLKSAGEGPTSTVVHTRRPFVLDSGNETIHLGGVPFGHMENISRSAIHVPILTDVGTSRERLFGVLSAQSYQPNAYTREAVRALELLAEYMGGWMQRDDNTLPKSSQLIPGVGELSRRPAIAAADAMVEMVRGLRITAEELASAVPLENASLQCLAQQLCEECRRVQVEALQLPLRLGADNRQKCFNLGQEPAALSEPHNDRLDVLTKTERRVLEQLQLGETDAVMARQLRLKESTVKFHLRNIYCKLNVSNRLQAVQRLRPPAASEY